MTLPQELIAALGQSLPAVMRWAGAVARQLRQHNIAISGEKTSGSALTDALTLADLTVQELLVAALRDAAPCLRTCRIEAEETTGDLAAFARSSPHTISLDPIDGTKQYRDKTGNGYAVMAHLRDETEVLYSLLYIPEKGPQGWWVETLGQQVRSGADDWSQPALEVLHRLPPKERSVAKTSNAIYLIGFQHRDREAAQRVTQAGLLGVAPDDMPGSIYQLMADGDFVGSLIHTPNVYDFPVALHIARAMGGDAVWVHQGEPVHFRETWMDDTADMVRLPGIVATSTRADVLPRLIDVAREWNTTRYRAGDEL